MTVDENGNIHEYGPTKEEIDRLYAYLEKMRSEKKDEEKEEEKEVDVWEDGLPEEAWERLFKELLNPTPAPPSVIESLRRVLKTTSLGEPLPLFKKPKKFTDIQMCIIGKLMGSHLSCKSSNGELINDGVVFNTEMQKEDRVAIYYEDDRYSHGIAIEVDDIEDIVIKGKLITINVKDDLESKYEFQLKDEA